MYFNAIFDFWMMLSKNNASYSWSFSLIICNSQLDMQTIQIEINCSTYLKFFELYIANQILNRNVNWRFFLIFKLNCYNLIINIYNEKKPKIYLWFSILKSKYKSSFKDQVLWCKILTRKILLVICSNCCLKTNLVVSVHIIFSFKSKEVKRSQKLFMPAAMYK